MSHSKVEVSRKRRVFSEEFKQDAVRLGSWSVRTTRSRLRRELRRAEMEREILKKATAHFAQESL